ncbi:MAG: ABC transporter permease [Actinobacteria bacterium]|nr:ABC transporter permease [Actinomycetota bacterium]
MREIILLLLIIIVCAVFGSQSKTFFIYSNIKVIFAAVSVNSIIAIGVTILFIAGGFDLSVGTHLSFLGVFLGMLLGNGVPVYLSVIMTMILGIFDGFLIGFIVSKLGVNSFVATLGAMFIFWGLALIIGYASKVAGYTGTFGHFPVSFINIASRTIFKIELLNIYMIIIVVILYVLLNKNVFFRQSFYVGGNENIAKLMGIKTKIIVIFNFVLVSLMVAVAAILRASRYEAASSWDGGQSMSLIIIAAVILGGASLKGGSGSILGTILGVILLAIISNGLTLLAVDVFYTDIVVGVILLSSVLLDRFIRKSVSTSLDIN